MNSSESEVLARHLSLFDKQSVVFFGGIHDDFPFSIHNRCTHVSIFSSYLNYVRLLEKTALSSNQPIEIKFGIKCDIQAELFVFYWLKNKVEATFQLLQLLNRSPLQQKLLLVGENKSGIKSVEKILAPYGDIHKIDSARRCSLYSFTLTQPPCFDLAEHWQKYSNKQFAPLTIWGLAGVFGAKELDVGTELLLSSLPSTITGNIVDMGCGNGVIGSYIKLHHPNCKVLMCDANAMAVISAQRTVDENNLDVEVIASDVFSNISTKFDLIIANPPFHDGISVSYHVVETLIAQAKDYLVSGGEIRIVANSFLPYAELFERYFNSYTIVANTSKFKVYSATKN